jgi:hypothetical protein
MTFDWITWTIWGIGLAIVIGWLVNVSGEIRMLLKKRKGK